MAWIENDQGSALLVRQAAGQRLWTLPRECLMIGAILGLWFERDISQIILEVPEEVMEELEDECRERCVSLEFLIVDRMNTCRDAGIDPDDWWKG